MRQPKPFFRASKQAWYLQINGRQRSLGKDKEAAWKKYHQIMADIEPIKESSATIALVFERYLDWVEENRKPGTYKKIQDHLQKFSAYIGLNSKAMGLTGADLSLWVESEKTWNSTTKNEGIVSVIRAFNWAVGKNHLSHNPVEKVPDKPKRKRREIVFSQDDWKELRGLVKDQPFGDFLDWMYETGCRPIECRTMEARHIDLKNGMVVFPPSEAKGERHERVIFLNDKALGICRRLTQKHPEGPIMRNTRGGVWTKDSINCRFYRLRQNFKRSCCAYAIRHTYATEALKGGMDSLTLSQLMGHSSVNQIAKTYAHLARNPEYLKKQARRSRNA